MTAFLFLVVVALAIWIARISSRTRTLESLIAKLTSRVFVLEEELKQLHKLVKRERAEPQPAPVVEKPVPIEMPAQAPIQPPLPVSEPETAVEPETPRVPPPVPAPAFQQAAPAAFSLSRLLNLEEALGTNWLNKLGIVILVSAWRCFSHTRCASWVRLEK